MATRYADITLNYQPNEPLNENDKGERMFIEAEIHLNARVDGPEFGQYEVEVQSIDDTLTHVKLIHFDAQDNETLTYDGKLNKCPDEWRQMALDACDEYARHDASDDVLELVLAR